MLIFYTLLVWCGIPSFTMFSCLPPSKMRETEGDGCFLSLFLGVFVQDLHCLWRPFIIILFLSFTYGPLPKISPFLGMKLAHVIIGSEKERTKKKDYYQKMSKTYNTIFFSLYTYTNNVSQKPPTTANELTCKLSDGELTLNDAGFLVS